MRWIRNIATATTCVLFAAGTLEAAITAYTVDANTAHLYHFDEQSATTTTADAVTTNPITLTIQGGANINNLSYKSDPAGPNTPPNAPFTTAGRAGATGGTARGFNGGVQTTELGMGDAFTLDTVVKLESYTNTGLFQIAAMNTVFQFRVSAGQLQFVNIPTASPQTVGVALPTTGDNAVDATSFFHLAIAYNGSAGATNNTSFYWTKLIDTTETANLIGTATLNADVNVAKVNTHPFGVGNRLVASGTVPSEELGGTIDEFRISNVARTADQFIFSVPEPSSLTLLGLGGLIGLRRTGRSNRRSV